jgi:hypothetical protein
VAVQAAANGRERPQMTAFSKEARESIFRTQLKPLQTQYSKTTTCVVFTELIGIFLYRLSTFDDFWFCNIQQAQQIIA